MGQFVRTRQQIDQVIYDEIADRRRSHPGPDSGFLSRNDILTLLMSSRDEAGEALSDIELRDELMTLLIAGHETTATAIELKPNLAEAYEYRGVLLLRMGRKTAAEKDLATLKTLNPKLAGELERAIKTGKEENGPGVKHSGQIR